MDMRLAYRMASTRPIPPSVPGLMIDQVALCARMDVEREMVKLTPKINLDNVAEFYAGHERSVWKAEKDIPNWAPPFDMFFVEWNEPHHWNINGEVKSNPHEGQTGFAVITAEVRDETRTDLSMWKHFLARASGSGGWGDMDHVGDGDGQRLRLALEGARWVLVASKWLSANVKPVSGRSVWSGLVYFLFVDGAGRLIFRCVGGIAAKAIVDLFGHDAIWSPIHILGLGLSFCHCKNVKVAEADEDRGERWHRRSGVPVLKFHTLDINPMRETLRREGKSEEVGIAKALHICRGHFATYTPEHPLFGKYVGTFWRPDHVRGNSAAGAIAKDYNIKPSDTREKP